MNKISKIDIGLASYYMRQGFEEGFLAASGDRGQSKVNPEKGMWFDHWLLSRTRAMLVSSGVISGKDTWR
jgi:hypothetical protein